MELALILPVLLALVLGIVELGRAYHLQTALSNAARDGVRVMALAGQPDDARRAATQALSPTLSPTDPKVIVTVQPLTCATAPTSPPPTATVTVTYPMTFVTDYLGLGTTLTITGTGSMRCNG